MSDELLPQEVSQEPPQKTPFKSTATGAKLELLPPHIKKEAHDLIAQGYGARLIKRAIEERFSNKTQFLPANEETWRAYISRHRAEIEKELQVQKQLVTSTQASLESVKSAMEVTFGESTFENKKAVLENLYKQCEQRISLIIEQQNQGFLNPQIESVLGSYIREQRTILETLVKMQEELRKDESKQVYEQLENLTYVWLVTVLNVYKQVNGETKFMEFKGQLSESLKKVIGEHKNQVNKTL